MRVITTREALRQYRSDCDQIAFVPTMGALHEGHLSLIRAAQSCADRVLVSIYVNPLQFGPSEDFDQYPRVLAADQALLADLGVDLWVPTDDQIYPLGKEQALKVIGDDLSRRYCGASRPGFFDGVLTVLLRFLLVLSPDWIVMGEKDFQQQFLLGRMIQDFGLETQLLSSALIREPSGLAMSSRNRYLDEEQAQVATGIYRSLAAAKSAYQSGETSVEALKKQIQTQLHPRLKLDYLALIDDTNFQEQMVATQGTRILIAAYLDNVRLIDNLSFA